jgi:hypothetical protein
MINIYYHIYLTDDKTWISLFLDQLKTFYDSSLDEKTDTFYISAIGNEQSLEYMTNILRYCANFLRCKVNIIFHQKKNIDNDLNNFGDKPHEKFTFESVMLQKLWEDCNFATEKLNVLYFHAKTVTSIQRNLDKNDKDFGYDILINNYHWRKFLDWGVIENHEECLELLKQKDVVSLNYSSWPVPHFSGNYWWATSEHIKKLPQPLKDDWWPNFRKNNNFPHYFPDRVKDEMWILSNGGNYHSLYNHESPPPKSSLASTLILRKEYVKNGK